MTERDEWTHLDELLTDYGNAAYTDGNNNADDSSERFTKSEAALRAAYDALRARAEAAESLAKRAACALDSMYREDPCPTCGTGVCFACLGCRLKEVVADRVRLAAQIARLEDVGLVETIFQEGASEMTTQDAGDIARAILAYVKGTP